MATSVNPPISKTRLKQIADDACNEALGSVEYYDHTKVADWNNTIIGSMLRAVTAEATPQDATIPTHKFACNSVIVQHLVPTSALNKPRGGTDAKAEQSKIPSNGEATSTDGKPHVGRRGMHSAVGAYWNDKEDGMWVHKYEGGEGKGLDVIITLLWIAL